MFSHIEHPDVVVVLDDSLLECADPTAGLKPGGWLIINSHLEPAAFAFEDGEVGPFAVATADASHAAKESDLIVAGAVMVNTAMLGAFARVTQLVSLEHIRRVIEKKFRPAAARKNFEAARLTYDRTLF